MRGQHCIPVAVVALLLIAAGLCWYGDSERESENAVQASVVYSQLSEDGQEAVPPFARSIYAAQYAHWQVGEWAWCFDVPHDSEERLRLWVNSLGGQAVAVSQPCRLSHMEPPTWWAKPADVRLVSNRRLEARLMSMWYSPSRNRVWILYCKL